MCFFCICLKFRTSNRFDVAQDFRFFLSLFPFYFLPLSVHLSTSHSNSLALSLPHSFRSYPLPPSAALSTDLTRSMSFTLSTVLRFRSFAHWFLILSPFFSYRFPLWLVLLIFFSLSSSFLLSLLILSSKSLFLSLFAHPFPLWLRLDRLHLTPFLPFFLSSSSLSLALLSSAFSAPAFNYPSANFRRLSINWRRAPSVLTIICICRLSYHLPSPSYLLVWTLLLSVAFWLVAPSSIADVTHYSIRPFPVGEFLSFSAEARGNLIVVVN